MRPAFVYWRPVIGAQARHQPDKWCGVAVFACRAATTEKPLHDRHSAQQKTRWKSVSAAQSSIGF